MRQSLRAEQDDECWMFPSSVSATGGSLVKTPARVADFIMGDPYFSKAHFYTTGMNI